MDKRKLRVLGLSDPEIRIYLALLESGPLLGSQLAKKTRVYRPYVYDTLEKLIGKGLVTYTIRKSKKEFGCAPPSALRKLLVEEQKQIQKKHGLVESLIPELEKIYIQKAPDYSIEVFEGKEGLDSFYKLLSSLIKKKKVKEVFSYRIDLKKDLREKLELKIPRRIVLKQTNIHSKQANQNRQKKGIQENGIITFNNYVAIIEIKEIIRVILIKNKNSAEVMKGMFDLLWKKQKSKKRYL